MIIGAIDPGKKGGLTLYRPEDNVVLSTHHVPVITPEGKKERPNYPVLAKEWEEPIKWCDHVFIELVGSMPKQGVASSFNFGYVAGFAYGLVLAWGIAHTFITPQKWKKLVGISGSDGATSIARACQLFPAAAPLFKRVTVDEGVAEAALMAYAGNLLLKGATNGG